ncbi:MAG: conserved rane protein of unknown function [Pseudonocardiales bacterium]|nr:conserved rane protein of unknown function [Pseudonocardiales bacterium]
MNASGPQKLHGRTLVAIPVAIALTGAADRLIGRSGLSGRAGWVRSNYRGRPVSLTGGAAVAVGAITAACLTAPRGWRAAVLVAGASAAAAGVYDDLVAPGVERSTDKGWRGHFGAVRSGRLSGGVVKVVVIGAGSLAAARLTTPRGLKQMLPSAALIATSANLLNLFDLRPGRAGKIGLAAAVSLVGGPLGPVAGAVAGAIAAELPADLGERRMMGDLGANALGALIGLRLNAGGSTTRGITLAATAGLTILSERVSFSKVIDTSPFLRAVDRLGRLAVAEK